MIKQIKEKRRDVMINDTLKIKVPDGIEFGKLYPCFLRHKFKTPEEMIYFGKSMPELLIAYKRSGILGWMAATRERIFELLGVIALGQKYIREKAQEYEMPEFPLIGYRNAERKNLEPLDVASKTRAENSTTFNCCGWCHYARATNRWWGSTYWISANCSFRSFAGIGDYSRNAFEKCFLKHAPGSLLKEISEGLKREELKLRENVAQSEREIGFLKMLKDLAEEKPVIPEHRDPSWWHIGGKVIIFGDSGEGMGDEYFLNAEIAALDSYPIVRITSGKKIGQTVQYVRNSALILTQREFQYFLENPEFVDFWITECPRSEYADFDGEKFKEEIRKCREKQSN